MSITDYVLHHPFDFQTHKATFINYCEVIILPNGLIKYAVPSHEQAILNYLAVKYNTTIDMITKKYYNLPFAEAENLLYEDSKCVLVWYDYYIAKHNLTKKQKISLKKLNDTGCCNFWGK